MTQIQMWSPMRKSSPPPSHVFVIPTAYAKDVFPKDIKLLQLNVEQLESQYKFQKPMLWGKMARGPADEAVWEATCKEAGDKWGLLALHFPWRCKRARKH